jgi:hypothetical protein
VSAVVNFVGSVAHVVNHNQPQHKETLHSAHTSFKERTMVIQKTLQNVAQFLNLVRPPKATFGLEKTHPCLSQA